MKRETLVLEKIINCTCTFVQEKGGGQICLLREEGRRMRGDNGKLLWRD